VNVVGHIINEVNRSKIVSPLMGDCLYTGKPCWYITRSTMLSLLYGWNGLAG